MKVQLNRNLLNQALTYTQKAIAIRPQLPVLGGILVDAQDDKCQIIATDLYLGIKTSIPGKNIEKGKAVIPGKQLRDLVGVLPDGDIEIETNDTSANIKSGDSYTTFSLLPVNDYPDFPEPKGKPIKIDNDLISQVSQKIMYSVSTDATRPVLTCVLFSFSEKNTNIVATDGFRLSLLDLKNQKELVTKPQQWLIPASALSEVIRISTNKNDNEVLVCADQEIKQIKFDVGDVQIYVRLMDGEYPPYEKIIPSEFNTSIRMPAAELLSHVKRAQVVTRDTSNIVELKITDEKLEVLARATTVASYKAAPETVKVSGTDCTIAFNAKYLIDVLKDREKSNIELSLVENLKPARLIFEDDPDFIYIIMPFRVNQQ